MSDFEVETGTEISTGEKRIWVRPELRKLDAGSAENGVGAGADDVINFS